MNQNKATLTAKEFHKLRKRHKLNCIICGKETVGLKIKKYCGSKCRSKAANLKRRPKKNNE